MHSKEILFIMVIYLFIYFLWSYIYLFTMEYRLLELVHGGLVMILSDMLSCLVNTISHQGILKIVKIFF